MSKFCYHKIAYTIVGRDGIWRTCKFDYHKDKEPVTTGTAKIIVTPMKFRSVLDMKEYIDQK
jgi:hypothetical protein